MIRQVAYSTLLLGFLAACNQKSDQAKTEETSEQSAATGDFDCFVYKTGKDSAFLHIDKNGAQVTGELSYFLFEKDQNKGKIEGEMSGDTLLAKYTFNSEGTESIREVAFLKQGADWIEGFAEAEERDGGMKFKDRSKLNFGEGLVFKGIACPEEAE